MKGIKIKVPVVIATDGTTTGEMEAMMSRFPGFKDAVKHALEKEICKTDERLHIMHDMYEGIERMVN